MHSLVPTSKRPGGNSIRRSKNPYGISSRRTAQRDTAAGMPRSARTTRLPDSRLISTHSRATPGRATTMINSRSSSNTSTGGSHSACVEPEAASRKNCRCTCSASSNKSQACAHIQLVGLRNDICTRCKRLMFSHCHAADRSGHLTGDARSYGHGPYDAEFTEFNQIARSAGV